MLKRELGLLDVFMITTGSMIAAGLFVLPGIAFSKAGSAVIPSYGLAALIALPTNYKKFIIEVVGDIYKRANFKIKTC